MIGWNQIWCSLKSVSLQALEMNFYRLHFYALFENKLRHQHCNDAVLNIDPLLSTLWNLMNFVRFGNSLILFLPDYNIVWKYQYSKLHHNNVDISNHFQTAIFHRLNKYNIKRSINRLFNWIPLSKRHLMNRNHSKNRSLRIVICSSACGPKPYILVQHSHHSRQREQCRIVFIHY